MLAIRNVSLGYGEDDVVRDVSFELENNKSLCIIGPNGCGKTTLLKAIAALLPFKGEIEIDGTSVQKMRPKDIAKKISLMNQTSAVYFSYSVFDTVMMGRYVHVHGGFLGTPSKQDVEYVMKCLSDVDLVKEKDQEITKLSGGQLQRVFLARTLAQEPEIILLDEPTNHLDLKYQIELIDYLREWSQTGGHSVVGVLHDINLAMRLSDNIMLMKDGEIAAIGNTDEVVTTELLDYVYDIDVVGHMKRSLQRWESIKN